MKKSSIDVPKELIEAALSGKLCVFMGAGVSAIPPSNLPNWTELAYDITTLLSVRATNRKADGAFDGTLDSHILDDAILIAEAFEKKSLVPEYSAQILHELVGNEYFSALSCLDACIPNGAHHRLAELSAAGFIDAFVTTNFDRLLEESFENIGKCEFQVFRDEKEFNRLPEKANRKKTPIIKVHGCCTKTTSMIDTLKQRKIGRQQAATDALRRLQPDYLLFLGFSGSDVLTAPNYLGFDELSKSTRGACYLAWPSATEVGEGAKALMRKFGSKGRVVTEDIEPFLDALTIHLEGKATSFEAGETMQDGRDLFRKKLVCWANTVSFPMALICKSALLEASGEGERAARVLDQAVRRASTVENVRLPDWPLVAFHNGRTGTAMGRFANVPDSSGNESNASAYSFQSLLLGASALGGRGTIHMPTGFLWRGKVELALGQCYKFLKLSQELIKQNEIVAGYRFEPAELERKLFDFGMSVEDFVDYWTSVAQVSCILQHEIMSDAVCALGEPIHRVSIDIGDPVRAAKSIAFRNLYLANYSQVGDMDERSSAEAERVGDKIVLGLNELVRGRLLVGASRDAISQNLNINPSDTASEALRYLQSASSNLSRGGMSSWAKYAQIQSLKALADQRNLEEVQILANDLLRGIHQFPALAPETLMVVGQIHMMLNDLPQAKIFFEDAEYNARALGFPDRVLNVLHQYLAKLPSL